jgi:hypothetical protein
MKDEYNNEAPYDFKNICFTNHNEPYYIGSKRNAPSTLSVGNVFTFTYLSYLGANAKDGTMSGLFTNNKIDTYYKNGIMTLGNNISISYEYSSGKKHVISNNILHKGCYNNTIVNTNDIVLNISCHDNYVLAYSSSITSGVIFDPQCGNNIICGGGYDIKFGGSCAYNIIAPVCGNILFHNDVVGNIIGATDTYYNGKTFANSSFYNSEWFGEEEDLKNKTIFDIINEKGINLNYGTSVKYLTFHHNARFNIVGNGAQLITIDDRSHHNVIGEYVTRVNMGKVCYKNIVYNIGYSVDGIAPKTYPSDIIFDNKTMCCTIGDNITSADTFNIHINQNCYSVKIPAGSENITIGNNVWRIESTNVLKNVNVKDDNANIVLKSDSAENVILNYTIETGTKTNNYSTSDEKTEIFIKSPNSSIASTIFNDGSNINEKLITNSGESLFIKKNDNSITVNPDLYPTPGKSGAAPSVGKNNGCLAIGDYGDYNGGVCNANGSFAGGASSIANAICSIAYGVGVKTEKATNKYGEVAFGMYNKPSNSTLLTIGNGSGDSDEKRSNAFEVNKNGSAIFSGSVTASAFYESSDERLKVFKSDIDVDLDKLAELRKSYFTFVEDPGTNHLGVSAQEIKELYPEIVSGDETLSVDYAKLSVIALKAVDKLHEENEMLRTELAMIKKHLGL